MLAGMSSAKLLIGRFMKQLFWKVAATVVMVVLGCGWGCTATHTSLD